MVSFIILFFPAAVGIMFKYKLEKREMDSIKKLPVEYAAINIFTNICVMSIFHFVLGYTEGVEYSIDMNMAYGLYYGVIACGVSLMIPIVWMIAKKYVAVSIFVKEVKDEE